MPRPNRPQPKCQPSTREPVAQTEASAALLTSRATVVAGCVHGLIPFEDEKQPANEQEAALNEQRRLFYVAITRCTEQLVLSSFTTIPKNVAYRIGARVIRGRPQIAKTIASQFWAELGPDAPARQSGNDWRQSDFA